MARKIIKGVLFVLAAVVVAGGIMTYLRSQKKSFVPTTTQSETAPSQIGEPQASSIQQVIVNAQGSSGAQVQIKGITSRNYNIQHLESGEGFVIQVPKAQIGQIDKIINQPHELIEKIEVRESADNPTTAELVFKTKKDVNFLDSQRDDMLVIDFVQTDDQGFDSETASSAEPIEEPVAKSKTPPSATATSKSSKTKSNTNSSSAKKSTSTNRSSVASRSTSTPKSKAPAVKVKPFDTSMLEEDAFPTTPSKSTPSGSPSIEDQKNDSLGFNTLGGGSGSRPATENIAPANEPPTISDNRNIPEEDDGFNLKDVVKEFGGDDSGSEAKKPAGKASETNLLDAETELSLKEQGQVADQKVASLPQNQQFDLNKIQANLPALQNMTVEKSGNGAIVKFDREKAVPFKVFRMVNPSRIVVDFKDTKNQLKADYPRFDGTKISRVETREYASVDGMLVRVILYVDGAPSYTSEKKGTQLLINVQ